MTVKLQQLGQSLVLVLDRKLLQDHRVDLQAEYSLELGPEQIRLLRLPMDVPMPEWSFEAAQQWVAHEYGPAFRVLAR